ncbi:hypothetical protein D3C85_1714310 [compost metagenome]
MGYHLSAGSSARAAFLPVPDQGHLQPQAVGWEVYKQESGELDAGLLQRSVISEQCLLSPPVLHSDNGAPM